MKLLSAFSTIAQTILLSVFLYSSTLWAFPFGSGLCPKSNPLLDVIKYVGKDQREYLDVGGPKLNLSAEEMDRIRKTTGILKCPIASGGYINASASLAGKGDEIITVAHAFLDLDTNKFREPLSNCTFTNFDRPPASSSLAITHSHQGLLMGHGFPSEIRNDYAFAKLKTPIISAQPFPVDLSDTAIKAHQKTVVVTAHQIKMPFEDPKQPIVESCGMEEPDFYGVSTSYFNDCTIMKGASGGAQLTRSTSGQLVLKSIITAEGPGDDGIYNRQDGRFGLSVAIGTRVLADLRKFDPSIQLGAGGIDDSH